MIKWLFMIVIILIIYAYCYFIFPTDITILQTTLNDFDFNLLHQRQPLVIEDCIVDITHVLDAWFRPNIIVDTYAFDDGKIWNINSFKYCLVYALNDTELMVYPAGKTMLQNDTPNNEEPVVAIKMKKSQSVIIPYKWYYNIKNKDVKLYGIHDYVTWLVDIFI